MAVRFKFYYWPIGFRGNFIRCLLAFKGIPFTECPVSELVPLRNADLRDGATKAIFMAPPLLYDSSHDLYISQMSAIVGHLGRVTGMMPQGLVEQAVTMNVLGNCNDILNEITRQCGFKMWTRKEFETFRSTRLVKWFAIMETTATRRGGLEMGKGYFFGSIEPTLVDIALFACFATLEEGLPELSRDFRAECPSIAALIDRLRASSDSLTQLMEIQMRNAPEGATYCGGQIEKSLREVLRKELPIIKEAWPEVVGMDGSAAKVAIEAENNVNVRQIQCIPEGSMVTRDYREDRVRIFTNKDGKVVAAPTVG